MERHFEEELRRVKQQVIEMGGVAEAMIGDAKTTLINADQIAADRVFRHEERINGLQNTIDDACMKILVRHQPMAGDLRLLVAILKMTEDLERIGDLAVNVVQASQHLMQHPPIKPYESLPLMADQAAEMVRLSLDSLVRRDAELAHSILLKDDAVDALKDEIYEDLLHMMEQDCTKCPSALRLIFVAQHYERIADHATNIAEDVIYMVTGKDVRHRGAKA